jgi:hypothetical protein
VCVPGDALLDCAVLDHLSRHDLRV